MESDTKRCAYSPGVGHQCENIILASNESEYCEVCRAVVLANAFRYCQDPTSPIIDRRDMVFANAIHLMTPEDLLRAIERTEWIYLNLQKAAITNKLDVHRRKSFEEATRNVTETRNAPRAPKAASKKQSKSQKLTALLGVEGARSLLGEDFSDL